MASAIMIKLIFFTMAAAMFSDAVPIYDPVPTDDPDVIELDDDMIPDPPRHPVCWTRYFNRDRPSDSGDWETLSDLRKEYPGEICFWPRFIEAVTTDQLIPAEKTGQIFFIYSPTMGFVCRNQDQIGGECFDYKVRFACPCE